MNDDEVKEFSLLDDEQTKLLEWLEDHPEDRDKFIKNMSKVMEAIGEAIAKVTEQLTSTIESFAALGAAYAEAKRIEEEDS